MDQLFWIIPGRLAVVRGRTGSPGTWGPFARRVSERSYPLLTMDSHAIRRTLSRPASHTPAFLCRPMRRRGPAMTESACAPCPQCYAFVQAQMALGHGVVVHCSSGKDRTGLFLAYFLMHSDRLSSAEAIQAVRNVRPIALSAVGWEEFARNVLSDVQRTPLRSFDAAERPCDHATMRRCVDRSASALTAVSASSGGKAGASVFLWHRFVTGECTTGFQRFPTCRRPAKERVGHCHCSSSSG